MIRASLCAVRFWGAIAGPCVRAAVHGVCASSRRDDAKATGAQLQWPTLGVPAKRAASSHGNARSFVAIRGTPYAKKMGEAFQGSVTRSDGIG